MRLFPPALEIADSEGFSQNDIFDRKNYGESLARLCCRAEDALVIGLDAPWGEGKTTFVKQWMGLLKEEPYQCETVYFDAFRHDYLDDPMGALADEFYAFIDKKTSGKDVDRFWEEQKPGFMESAAIWVAHRAKSACKVVGAGAGALMGASAGGAGPEAEALTASATAAGEEVGSQIEGYFKARQEIRRGIEGFRDALTAIGSSLIEETDKPLIFIIDELDRCRPDFALDLLEKVKHVFSVPGIVFVLVYNGEQMEEHIRCRYGTNVNASIYLNKFISLSTILPKQIDAVYSSNDSNDKYAQYLSHAMNLNMETSLLSFYAGKKGLSFREIERLMTLAAIVKSSVHKELSMWNAAIIGICLIHLIDKSLFNKVSNGEECWDEINIFFEFDSMPQDVMDTTFISRFRDSWDAWRNPNGERELKERYRPSAMFIIDDIPKYYCKSLQNFLPSAE